VCLCVFVCLCVCVCVFVFFSCRNFRCDCGNSKFRDFQCQLNTAKDEENIRNHYNHNFSGFYCTCDRPYPDADDQVNDEMIQCVVCEDWFHSRHLGCTVVDPEELQEMACEACMNKAPFLWTYAAHFAGNSFSRSRNTGTHAVLCYYLQEEANQSSPCKRTHEQMTGSPGKATTKTEACRLKELQAQGLERQRQGAVFWPYSWRSELCTCTNCKRAYVAAEVQFLMDQSDTILAYENKGLNEPFGQHPLMALTNSLDRVQQLEIIYGEHEGHIWWTLVLFVCMTNSLPRFYQTVTVEAVHQFFEELRARKRRRTNAGYQ
uniref:Putative E3 ubiquitin-protein ligase UBR7 n=1 Tax=Scophthalmus maximus TaxID=52904 RepID=A0A8D3BMI6_SCOMX